VAIAPPEYPSIATFASLGMVDELTAARIESSVFIPYSGPAAKSARWPSVSGTMTVYPPAMNGPKTAASTLGMSPPSLSPPQIAYDGSSLRLRESYADWYEITFVSSNWIGGAMTEVTLTVGLPVWLVDR
jgi:hypothetical protein